MHRTKHANCAVRCNASNFAHMKQKCSSSIAGQSNDVIANSVNNNKYTINNNVCITNVHHIMANKKMMSTRKTKKSNSIDTIKAPETALTPPSTPSSPLGSNDDLDFMYNSWSKFTRTDSGETDNSIIVYRPKKIDKGFEPFNIDRYLAEKLLRELDIDTKYAIF